MLLKMAEFHCFQWLSNSPLLSTSSLSIYLLMDTWLFPYLSCVNYAAVNIGGACIFLHLCFPFFSDIYPGVKLLDRMVVLFLVFHGTSILFSIVVVPVCIPTNSIQVFAFLHIFINSCYV